VGLDSIGQKGSQSIQSPGTSSMDQSQSTREPEQKPLAGQTEIAEQSRKQIASALKQQATEKIGVQDLQGRLLSKELQGQLQHADSLIGRTQIAASGLIEPAKNGDLNRLTEITDMVKTIQTKIAEYGASKKGNASKPEEEEIQKELQNVVEGMNKAMIVLEMWGKIF
jgi:hypothetical protein